MAMLDNPKLASLAAKYKKKLLRYLTELQGAAQHVHPSSESLHVINNIAHRLSGSGAAYGFVELSQRARALDIACEQALKHPPSDYDAIIAEPLHDLMSCIERCLTLDESGHQPNGVSENAASDNAPGKINILLADDDPDFSSQISQILTELGYTVHCLDNISGLEQAIAHHQPLALIVDMDFFGQRFAGAEHVNAWRQKDGSPPPVIFISAFDSFALRLAAARAGGNHFLSKPLDVPKLISLLHADLNLAPSEPYRVMLVDDDTDLLNLYGSVLSLAGYSVSTATSAQQALSMLESKQPELLIIDVFMPGCNGLELGMIIRQHEEYATIPLLFMSAAADTDVQLACARLTNDEFISKPIEPWRLRMVVKSRVSRGRLLRAQGRFLTTNDALSHQDPLTGLPTLGKLRIAVEQTLRQFSPNRLFAVIKIDIRDFHTINNLNGNFFGDQVLQQVAWELSHCLDNEDVLGRQQGDEFLILSHGHDSKESVKTFAERLTQAVENTRIESIRSVIALSVDMGIAIASPSTRSADELLDQAEMALFQAKKSTGASLCFFDASMLDQAKQRFDRAQRIRQALVDGEFIPAYQPIVRVDDASIVGFEALARWQHPDQGVLGPGAFIQLMEEQDLIGELTALMLSKALPQLARWQQHKPDLFVSINLSAKDIQHPAFQAQLETLLAEHRLAPEFVVLEITETLLLSDWQQASMVIEELRQLGVRLALDDFGTGYSSMSYLHRVQAAKLKIDRSFIQHWSQTGDTRLIKAMVQLGHSMDMTIIAEGVENAAELSLLQQLHCDQYQGFFTARPLFAEEVEAGHWL